MAVVFSGDGGWRDIDKDIAGRLQQRGIPVVGVDSLRYFWSREDAREGRLRPRKDHEPLPGPWQRPDVVLVGYSFGADILPFVYNRLGEGERAQVTDLALLGFSHSADFEIHVTGWLGVTKQANSRPTAPELAKIPVKIVQCFYGRDDTDTACTSPELRGARLVETPGGHHFDGDYGKLADAIVAATEP